MASESIASQPIQALGIIANYLTQICSTAFQYVR